MGDEQCCDVLPALNATDFVAHRNARRRVERGKRFVEKQRAGAEHQRSRERHALLLSAGELRRKPVGKTRESDELEHLG